MSTKYNEVFTKLMAPFADEKSRKGSGRDYSYITARQAMNRLDEVLGPDGWFDTYQVHDHGCICTLTLVMPDGVEVTKQDGGGGASMDDEDNEFKSMISDAFKRAAAKVGVGRYLYRDGVPGWAGAAFEGYHAAQGQSSPSGNGNGSYGGGGGGGGNGSQYSCPKHGKGLFAWMKDREAEFNYEVLGSVNQHPAIKNVFPQRMTEWDQNQIAFGYSLMKQLWTEAGKWPAGAGNSPGEVANGNGNGNGHASAPGALAPPEATPEELKAIKGKIRSAYEAIIKRDNPATAKVTYPMLMARVNIAAAGRGFQVPEMVAYRDMGKLNLILADGEAALHGAGASTDPDEIPF